MKCVVMNFSGNVGKSTVARHLLAPRMGDCEIIAVETINSDGTEVEGIKGKQFDDLVEALALKDAAVIDVGASNVEVFMKLMEKQRGSHEDFDYFVIPTVAVKKQMRDTISTVEELSRIGVSPDRIKMVFNRVDFDDDARREFAPIIDYHDDHKRFSLSLSALIEENEFFSKAQGASINEVLADATDYKALIKAAESTEDKLSCAEKITVRRLAASAKDNLDDVFKALFGKGKK